MAAFFDFNLLYFVFKYVKVIKYYLISKFVFLFIQGIAFADYSPKWRFYRKIAHSSMRMFGNGLKNIENLVATESRALHVRFDEQIGQPMDPHYDLGKT